MSGPRFTPQAVLEIRQQFAARTLNVRAWAETYRVSLETIRRIARGDTYRDLPEAGGRPTSPPALAPTSGPVLPPLRAADEPDPEAIAASFARLAAAQAARPPDAQALLDELQGRGQPGLPGGRPTAMHPALGAPYTIKPSPDKETP